MSIVLAIAALCELGGEGSFIYRSNRQEECHVYYATCMLNSDIVNDVSLLKCMRKRIPE